MRLPRKEYIIEKLYILDIILFYLQNTSNLFFIKLHHEKNIDREDNKYGLEIDNDENGPSIPEGLYPNIDVELAENNRIHGPNNGK